MVVDVHSYSRLLFLYYLLPAFVLSIVARAVWIQMYVLFTFKVFDLFLIPNLIPNYIGEGGGSI